jgi:hypothetical protein
MSAFIGSKYSTLESGHVGAYYHCHLFLIWNHCARLTIISRCQLCLKFGAAAGTPAYEVPLPLY